MGSHHWSGLFFFIVNTALLLCTNAAHAQDWSQWWTTEHQRASESFQQQDFEALVEQDDQRWKGIGLHHQGDHNAAAEAFGHHDDIQSRYNAATALTHAGDYEQAIEQFDELLKLQPDHAKASHNRSIAEQLLQVQQQSSPQQGNEDEQQQSGNDQRQDQGQQPQASQQQNEPEDSSSEQTDGSSGESQQQDQQPVDENQQAMQEQSDESPEPDEQSNPSPQQEPTPANDEPLSEQAQATEQWLRRIPDDPSGLLRRKLERSHQLEYPNVTDGTNPW